MKVMAVRWREMEEGEVVCPLPAVAVYDDEGSGGGGSRSGGDPARLGTGGAAGDRPGRCHVMGQGGIFACK